MLPDALIIFVKNPIAGKVKSRLAKTIGDKEALAIYRQLLLHTYNITSKCNADKFVFYADFINDDDLWNNGYFQKHLQDGINLGEKMLHAFDLVLEQGYSKAVIIGSDSIEIEASHIQNAFDYLDNYDLVIGPAQDGGYYLLGLQVMHEQLFLNKSWSTPKLLQQTIDEIEQLRLDYHLLQKLSDVDEEKDLYLLHHRQ